MSVTFVDGSPLVETDFDPLFEENSPRAVAVINGRPYKLLSYQIVRNAHGATDTASIDLPIHGNPDFTIELFRGVQYTGPDGTLVNGSPSTASAIGAGTDSVVEDESPVFAEIYAGFPDKPSSDDLDISQLTRQFLGIVDVPRAEFHQDVVTFSCRTIAARLVDDRITHLTSTNETVEQFVKDQAARYGLSAVTKLPPGNSSITIPQVLGREFVGGGSFTSTLYRQHIWDIITRGAEFDDVDAWVDDTTNTIYYAALSLSDRGAPIAIKWGRDFTLDDGAIAEHAIAFSKRVRVEAHSYSKKTRMSTRTKITSDGLGGYSTDSKTTTGSSMPIFGTSETISTSTAADGTVTVTSGTSSGGAASDTPAEGVESNVDRFPFFKAGLTPAQLNQFAVAQWRRISQNQYRLTFALPMTRSLLGQLKITSIFAVSGLPYLYFNASDYLPRRMTFTFGDSGWKVLIEAVTGPIPAGEV